MDKTVDRRKEDLRRGKVFMSKIISFISILFLTCFAYADRITSLPYTPAAGEVVKSGTAIDPGYNQNNETMVNEINNITGGDNGNIADNTVAERNMADDVNPRIRWDDAFGDWVVAGLLPATSGTLTSNICSGYCYTQGYYILKDTYSKTYEASKDTYVDIHTNGQYSFIVMPNGSGAPSIPTSAQRLAKVVTNGSAITSVEDLRVTSLIKTNFDGVRDNPNEASLNNLMGCETSSQEDDYAFRAGVVCRYATTATVTITKGAVTINKEKRRNTNDLTVSIADHWDYPVVSAFTVDTTYYLWVTADTSNIKTFDKVIGTSATSPDGGGGYTNYRLAGMFRTDSTGLICSVTNIGDDVGETVCETGWFAVDYNHTYTIYHFFNQQFYRSIIVLYSANAAGTSNVLQMGMGTTAGTNGNIVAVAPYDNDYVKIQTGSTYILDTGSGPYGAMAHVITGYFKVVLIK